MRLRKHIWTLVLLMAWPMAIMAQSTSPSSMFSEIQSYYNPAANGNREVLTADFFYRKNKLGIPGSLSNQSVNIHTPLKNPKVAMGLLVEHESFGSTIYTGMHVSYAYRLSLGSNTLSFGLRAGIINGAQSNITSRDEVPDPVLDVENMRYWVPNLGFGVLFYNKRFWAGLSIPRFFGTKSNEAGDYIISFDLAKREYIAMAGASLALSADFGIEPSLLVGYTPSIPMPVLAANVMGVFKNRFKAGVGYRYGDAIILLTSMNVNRQFSFGYSYDMEIGEKSDLSSGSHEIHLHYKFGYNINASNPRGF